MRYEFVSVDDGHDQNCFCAKAHAAHGAAICEIDVPMSKAPVVGQLVRCPSKGCKGHVKRIYSSELNFIIKGSTQIPWDEKTLLHSNVNGKDIAFRFVDHKEHNDPVYQAEFAKAVATSGCSQGMCNAYRSEKFGGRAVVDVVSNSPDPLGEMSRAKQRGEWSETKKKVGQPYRTRKKGAK